jgi:hypothetical protein
MDLLQLYQMRVQRELDHREHRHRANHGFFRRGGNLRDGPGNVNLMFDALREIGKQAFKRRSRHPFGFVGFHFSAW